MILADAVRITKKILTNTVPTLLTGTDEHGIKVQEAASNSINTQTYCDVMSSNFYTLAKQCINSPFAFVRTTDSVHQERVQSVWKALQQSGLIYKGTHKGWYCINDECFVSDSSLHANGAISIGNGEMRDAVGRRYAYLEEEAYKFKAVEFIPDIKRWALERLTILPEAAVGQIAEYLNGSVEEIPISRPSSHQFSWGISVPDDERHLVYVWFDALLGYLANNRAVPECQVFGKDILKFHVLLFPAMLLALNLPLPKRIVVHSHWLVDGMKMSKSLGNCVNLEHILPQIPIDSLRYYLLKESKLDRDGSFSVEALQAIHKNDLVDGIGNLVSRCMNAKFIDKSRTYTVQPSDDLLHVIESAANSLENVQFNVTIGYCLQIIADLNTFINSTQLWKLINSSEREKLHECMEVIMGSLYAIAIILTPIMPHSMAHLLDVLGVPLENRTIESLCNRTELKPCVVEFQKFNKMPALL